MDAPRTLRSLAKDLGLEWIDGPATATLEADIARASRSLDAGASESPEGTTAVGALLGALASLVRKPNLAVMLARVRARIDELPPVEGHPSLDPTLGDAIARSASDDTDRVFDDLFLARALLEHAGEHVHGGLARFGLSAEALRRGLDDALALELDGERDRPLADNQRELDDAVFRAAGRRLGDLDEAARWLERGRDDAEAMYAAGSPSARRIGSHRALRRHARGSGELRLVPRLLADFALSDGAREVLGLADRLRGDARHVHVEHLVVALYDAKASPARAAFDRAGVSRDVMLARLHGSELAEQRSASYVASERVPPLSSHAALALVHAARHAANRGDEIIRSRDLLTGVFAVEGCHIVEKFTDVRVALASGPEPARDPDELRTPAAPQHPMVVASSVARFGGDGLDGPDVLGFTLEVDALARLVASEGIDPPLSIGLFGEWGSGKSYFMRRLRERIEQLAAATRRRRERDDVPPPAYVGHVVQVEFNAWNYVEVDLWASLVAHIFDRLHAHVIDEPGLEQRQWESLLHRLDDAENRRHDAKQALELAQARLDMRRREQAARERTLAYQIEILRRHAKLKRPIAEIEGTLGIAAARELWDAIVLRSSRATAVIKAMPDSLRAARSLFTGPAAWWLMAAIALVIGGLLLARQLDWLPDLAAVAAAMPLLLAWVRKALGRSDALLAAIEAFQEGLLELERSKQEVDREALERLRDDAMAVEQARAEHDAERARVDSLRDEIARLYPGEQLADFLADRAASSDYRRHLGLPALVRRDFERLGRLVRPHTHRLPRDHVAGIALPQAPKHLLDMLHRLEPDATEPFEVVRVERSGDRVRAFAPDGRCAIFSRCEPVEGDENPAPYEIDLRTADDEPLGGPRDELGRLGRRVPQSLVDGLRPAMIPARLAELLRRDAPLRGERLVHDTTLDRWVLTDHDGARRVEIGFDGELAIVEIGWPMHPTIERIVLYIDDLDRCPPERVVEVLGAVHLLLAFPLFVVVVAVDERWLVGSLEDQHAQQLRPTAAPSAGSTLAMGAFDGLATPRDYLEKIFQIPYWVPRMTTAAARDLIADMVAQGERIELPRADPTRVVWIDRPRPSSTPALAGGPPPEVETAPAEVPGPDVEDEPSGGSVPGPDVESSEGDDGGMPGFMSLAGTAVSNAVEAFSEAFSGAAEPTAAPTTDDESGADDELLRVQPISIGERERLALQALVPLVQKSPRAVKRFVNVYRVIRSTLGDQADVFMQHDDDEVPFGPATVLIAMMVGDPEAGASLIAALEQDGDDDGSLHDSMQRWIDAKPTLGEATSMALTLALTRAGWARQRRVDLRGVVGRVRRFSFGARNFGVGQQRH